MQEVSWESLVLVTRSLTLGILAYGVGDMCLGVLKF